MATIVIHSGRAWAPWAPQADALDTRGGLGGSQVAATRMAHALAVRDDVCTVVLVGDFTSTESRVPKLHYKQMHSYEAVLRACQPLDLLVVSRYTEFLPSQASKARKVVLWCHDTTPMGTFDRQTMRCDAVLCLSDWHLCHVSKVAPELPSLVRTRNGLAQALYADQPWSHKVAGRFVYSSAIYRGLDTLLNAWPHIRARCPHATLHIYADFDAPLIRQRMAELGERLRAQCARLADQGVRVQGFVSQQQLRQALYECDVWLYPTNFCETYCISALEAQASGALCVYTPLAALPETIGDRGIALPNGGTLRPAQLADAVAPHVSELNGTVSARDVRTRARQWALEQTWDGVAQDWLLAFT